MKNLFKMKKKLFYALSLLVCLLGVSENAWAFKSTTHLRTYTAEPASGLVYAEKDRSESISDNKFTDISISDGVSLDGSTNRDFYGWAKPARGWSFNNWVGFDWAIVTGAEGDEAKKQGAATPKAHTGNGDVIVCQSWSGNAGEEVWRTAQATWIAATSYNVTYKEPVGGSYSVEYSYLTVSNKKFVTSTETLDLTPGSEDKQPHGISDGSQEGLSYAADVVTLSTEAGNFVGWYEGDDFLSSENPYTYPVTKNANVKALFKWIEPVAPEEKLVRTTNNSADVNESVVFSMDNIVSTWATADFTATLVDATGSGTFTLGEFSYNATDGELTVNFTYNANGNWEEGSSVTIQVAPVNASYGTTASVLVKAIAQENSANQARVSGDDFATQEGDLTDMLAVANAHTEATLTLLNSVTVSSPLVVTASMTLDLNNWILSSTAANKIISVEGTDTKLTISDNSFLKGSEIQLTRSANAAIAAIEVTGSNRLLYNHGKMTVVNNAEFASNANAKAYGIYVSGAGNAVMQGGSIAVESDHDARGVYIATGNATLNVGKIVATAKSQAYALYSGGKINVAENISLTAKTTTGSDASALYLTGGTAVVDNVPMTATTKTNNAFGVNVQGGKLTLNGGTIAATATTAGVYGVYVAASGNVTIQQQATITADGPGTSALPVYGIQNLGTLKLINSAVTATSTTNYATAVSSMTSAISTTIEGGTYDAVATTDHAYGLHHQYGALNVDGGTFTATTETDAALAVRAGADGTIANATIIAETKESGKTARGFTAGVEGINVSLTNCTIKAKSATSTADAIYSRANVTATGCELEAKTLSGATANGFYAEKGTNVLMNTNATVESYTTEAYGVNFVAGSLTVNGGTYNVTAKQAIATGKGDSEAYGIKVADGKTANLSNATFSVNASNKSFSQNVYGAYTSAGTINSTGCTYSVSSAIQAYGVWGDASSELNLQNNTITAHAVTSTTAYGIYSNGSFGVNGDDVTAITQGYTSYTLFFGASANGEVLSGKFKAEGISNDETQIIAPINKDASANNVHIKGGFFNDIVQLNYYVPTGYDIYGVDLGAAEYAQGYYYTVNDHLPYENVCYITEVSTGFKKLEDAFDYARNHSDATYNIIMTQPYTLPEGNYSLPANATLVVPYKGNQTTAIGDQAKRRAPQKELITEIRQLKLADGANIDVYGKIEVSAEQYVSNVGRISFVLGPYGRIHMEEGSTITLNNGAAINAWGYITGQGEIRVKNGAKVREFFQMHDITSAKSLSTWANEYKVFPLTQYYIQSIEAPTKYYYGAELYGQLGVTMSATDGNPTIGSAKLVGTEDALFTVDTDDESAWVRKTYNPTTDRIVWETNSSASLGHINIEMGTAGFDSKDYVLPFTNNMTVHALSGLFTITQNTVLLPGCEVEVDKTATLHINEEDINEDAMGLYLYDLAQWGKYASSKYFVPAMYSPSWTNGVCPRGDGSSNAGLKDAAVYVKGKIEVEGSLYTTAGGAAIYSDDTNAGTIEFSANAADDTNLYYAKDAAKKNTVTSAQLRNGGISGSSFTPTKDVAEDGDAYAYANIDGNGYKWTRLKTIDDCTIADATDPENPVYYAKPQGYVAITSDTEDDNHLFHSAVGSRLFIQQSMEAGCQWWEVTQVGESSVYHCATNNTDYEWTWLDPDHHELGEGWMEVKRTVTFYFSDPKSEEADKKKVLTVNYGAKPDVSIVPNPSKAEDAAATYQFSGWKYSETGDTCAYTDQDCYEAVTENGTYYLPVFDKITKKYTITLHDAKDGETVPIEVFYDSIPNYTATKAATAEYTYTFDHWEPALEAVTGPATYTAYWTSVKNRYNITWVNGETTLEEDKNVLYGAATSYDGALPTKETDDDFVYAFSGWLSSLDGNTYANGSTPAVGGHTTYTAQYNTTPRYAITFANYDGSQLQKESVTQGEHPAYDEYKYGTPARVRDVDGYYKFTGWKDLSGTFYAKNAMLPEVTDHKETYTAQYDYVTELYLITLRNVKGQGAAEGDNIWSGKFGVGATPFYDPNGDDIADVPAKTGNAQYSYAFNGWSLEQDGDKIDPMPEVTGVATYWALFAQSTNKYTITFANVDGNGAEETVEVEYGQTPVCPVTPAKGDNYYTYPFTGWDQTIVAVTGDATYTAQFGEGVARTFTITFEPENGGAAEVLSVAYGQMPAPTIPSKTNDAQYSYAFNSWAPALTTVTEDATYYAQYTQTVNRYTIRFENYDGSELQSEYLNYGVTPSYASTPSKPTDWENLKMYTFTGWKNTNNDFYAKGTTLPSVAKNETYTAQYDETTIVATVTTSASVTKPYDSFGAAFNAANGSDGNTIKLQANVADDDNTYRSLSRSMSIDLNGYTLSEKHTNTTTYYFYINGGYTLTINDSREGGKIYFEGTGNANYYTVDVHSGSGVLTVNGGTLEAKSTTASSSYWVAAVQVYNTNSRINLYGGALIASATSSAKSYAVKHDYSDGKVYIYGGKLKAGTDILGGTVNTSNSTLSGGYYSKTPNGSYTLGSGNALLNVRDDAPDASLKAEYPYKVAPAHTVTFKNWNDATIQSGASEDGLLPIVPADPTRPNADGRVYGFTGWSPAVAVVSADATYTAQYEVIGIDAETSGEDQVVIAADMTVTTTIVETNGTLNINSGVTLTTTDLILESTTNASGQIVGAPRLTIQDGGHAYFDVQFNGETGTANRTWYAIAVPWEVDAENGILWKEGNRKLVLGRDFDLVWYDGEERAAHGDGFDCWKYVEYLSDKKMHPGKAYMMYFGSQFKTVRFEKTSTAPIIYTGDAEAVTSVETYDLGTGDAKDGNWNGIANPAVYHAKLNAGATFAQVLGNGSLDDYFENPTNPVYTTIDDMTNYEFVVGKPIFVQAPSDQSIVVTPIIENAGLAPRRARTNNLPEGIDVRYAVHIALDGHATSDNLFVQATEEEKADTYVIGMDLAKGGVAKTIPQLWVDRYDSKLSANTQTFINDIAEYPLSLYAPKEGEYVINTDNTYADYDLYLMQDGNVIWNLSNNAYTILLPQGTTTGYGLRISAKKAPQVATGMDEAVADAQGETRKVIINDKVYIIRNNNVYSADGQLVK